MTETSPVERRFVVDNMLGKLAKSLRSIGFDTRYASVKDRGQLSQYQNAGFLVVTRNQRWRGLDHVLFLGANDPEGQLVELIEALSISSEEIHPLSRCTLCNASLLQIARDEAFGRVPDFIFETNESFHRCPVCQRVYWRGSHPKRIVERLERLLGWSIDERN